MRSGVRLTCLKNGDALLGEVWIYKELSGEEAIQQKLEDLFLHISKLKFTDVIDTIQINKDSSNNLYIGNSGVNGDLWPFSQRIETYRKLCNQYKLNLVLELEFPTVITSQNLNSYMVYATDVINTYPWVKYWQIMTEPESRDAAGMKKCPPNLYVQLIKYIYTTIHTKYHDIKIGGPGICNAIAEYVNSKYITEDGDCFHTGWLASATGEYYGVDPNDDDIGPSGFLKYIDFFAFQGRQNYVELNYNIYQNVIKELRTGLITQAQRDNYNLDIEFLSTYQGHDAERGNYNDMQLQAYRDLREFINAFKVDVVPFKTQLVDEFYDPDDPTAIKNISGLLYYFLGNEHKPAYDQYLFLNKYLENYVQLADNTYNLNNKRPFIVSNDVHYIMLMNKDKSMMGTVIFPASERNILVKNPIYVTVTLKPAINRYYYLPDGTNGLISTPIDITFKNYDFIFVEEQVASDISVDDSILKEAEKRIELYSTYAQEMLDMVPDDYVKDVYDGMNFPKLLRAVANEHADLEYERDILRDNMYLKTAHGDAIYNNFGAMIEVPWRRDWDEEKYRSVVSSLIESLLTGATKASIEKALRTYTTFDVHIYELFKDYEHYGMTKDMHYENQYSFVVEIEKDLDSKISTDKLYDDVRMLVDIVRPAHTIPIIMVVLIGKEDYADWYENKYGIPWKDSDVHNIDILSFEESNKFGWKYDDYDLAFHNNQHNLNSSHVIGPKYTLHDNDWWHIFSFEQESYDKVKTESFIDLYSFYKEEYDRTPEENYEFESTITCIENKFGIRPLDNTLQTNIKNLWGNNYTPRRMMKTKSLSALAPSNDDDFVTGFEYILRDDDNYDIFAKNSETFETPEEELYLDHVIFENEEFEKPDEFDSYNHQINLWEISFRYRVEQNLKTYSFYNDTYLNHYKTAIAPRLDEECFIHYDFIESEKFNAPKDKLIYISSNIEIAEDYDFKDDELILDQKIDLKEHSFKYKDDHSLMTFFEFNRQLNSSKTAIAERNFDEMEIDSFITNEEYFKSPLENSQLESDFIAEENYQPKNDESLMETSIPLEEDSYKFNAENTLKTFCNFSSHKLNSSKTAIALRLSESFESIELQNIFEEALPHPEESNSLQQHLGTISEIFNKPQMHSFIKQTLPFEENYKIKTDEVMTTMLGKTNSCTTAVKLRTNESCFIKVYKIENGKEILINEVVT